MSSLAQDLDMLRKLNQQRTHAKTLREQALRALKRIGIKDNRFIDKDKSEPGEIDFKRWVGGNKSVENDLVELALLVKLQNHRDISEDDKENNKADAPLELKKLLQKITLKSLIQLPGEDTSTDNLQPADVLKTIPVLTAARVMQALVSRAETVFEPTTMYCYYRIIRELYGVAQPNWTVGAARAGVGGTTSAFVTNECIRAIFSFENVVKRTYEFFEHVSVFYDKFSCLDRMLQTWGITDKNHPLYKWADKTVEAMWLDCYLSISARNREMALFWGGDDRDAGTTTNLLLLPNSDKSVGIECARAYFKILPERLKHSIDQLFNNVSEVYFRIDEHRKKEEDPHPQRPIDLESARNGQYIFNDKKTSAEETAKEERISKFNRTATAHEFALKAIEDAIINANRLQKIFSEDQSSDPSDVEEDRTKTILTKLHENFYRITGRVHRVLEPSKQYVKWVLNRELAASHATFDAGELVFAAMSYGVLNHWRLDDKLARACELLITTLPDTGRLPTKRPFHSNIRGYRTLPIGCEMTRALANLLQKTGYDFDENFIRRMLSVFEDNLIELPESTAKHRLIAWNFEGSPNPEKPAVWVTAISVLALDRIVRMLNSRINEIVLSHFDVTDPSQPHTPLTLHHLIYTDYGLSERSFKDESSERKSAAIGLQQTRAHVMRATLPKFYLKDKNNFSPIFYGPPGTGKTTLAESLALSASVPFLRLSPSDLILQGQELIEGRARDVFEALSMLTQCVVIFDEFEPVLKTRSTGRRPSGNSRKQTHEETDAISEVLWIMNEKEDPKFKFVLGGMLPKFTKLHYAAEKQSFAYCLGTNYLVDIDGAAKRSGRFDRRFPVYKPDVLSRAGLLFYRLSQTTDFKNGTGDPQNFWQLVKRFIDVIARTTDIDANQLNKLFKVEEDKAPAQALQYVFNPAVPLPKDLAKDPNDRIKSAEKDLENAIAIALDDDEKVEREWLLNYEKAFSRASGKINKFVKKGDLIRVLGDCLEPPKPGSVHEWAHQHQSRTE